MGERLLNSFISAVVGGIAAVGAVWFLSDPKAGDSPAGSENGPTMGKNASFDEIEVKRLRVTDGVWVHHSETGEPLIELKDGVVLAKKRVLADSIGACRMMGQKVQITTGDPSDPDSPVFSELATNEEGGAYFALLSPKGIHSVNIGFDKNETGFIISKNNQDAAMVAQAILPLPDRSNASAPMSGDSPRPGTCLDDIPAAGPTSNPIPGPTAESLPSPAIAPPAALPDEPTSPIPFPSLVSNAAPAASPVPFPKNGGETGALVPANFPSPTPVSTANDVTNGAVAPKGGQATSVIPAAMNPAALDDRPPVF